MMKLKSWTEMIKMTVMTKRAGDSGDDDDDDVCDDDDYNDSE